MKSVSIIIPVYNNQSGVNSLIDSISTSISKLHENYDVEIIIIDNNSESPIYIEEKNVIDIKLIGCEVKGSYAARNAGVRSARGDILVFTDSDCIATEGWLVNGISALGDFSDNRIVGGNVLFNTSERPSAVELYQTINGFMQYENITLNNFSTTANLFVYKVVFDKVGLFNEKLFSAGDLEWCWRAESIGLSLVYEKNSVVYTEPRKTLSGAIVQARRVAGGRKALIEQGLHIKYSKTVGPLNGLFDSLGLILSKENIGVFSKCNVLIVACIIKLFKKYEYFRLFFNKNKENR